MAHGCARPKHLQMLFQTALLISSFVWNWQKKNIEMSLNLEGNAEIYLSVSDTPGCEFQLSLPAPDPCASGSPMLQSAFPQSQTKHWEQSRNPSSHFLQLFLIHLSAPLC